MRKITFNEETISEIRAYAESSHSLMEACNRFTLTPDVLKRVAKENRIQFVKKGNAVSHDVDAEKVAIICNLFENTNMDLQSIRKTVGIRYDRMLSVISEHFSEEYCNQRKSKLYRLSKLGDKNPMLGKEKEQHPRYKGTVNDGNGYLMCLKPNWYTGRVGSKYVFVHSVVMCEHLGITEIPKGYIVHHIDGNKHNNNIDNLALMTISGHGKLHAIERNLCKAQRSEKIRRDNPETPDND